MQNFRVNHHDDLSLQVATSTIQDDEVYVRADTNASVQK